MHALWQLAAPEQARISGIGSRQADEIVTLMVSHLTNHELVRVTVTRIERDGTMQRRMVDTVQRATARNAKTSLPAPCLAPFTGHHLPPANRP
jgi:hypothetical protein